MSYYRFNRQELSKKAKNNMIIKEVNKRLVSIIRAVKKKKQEKKAKKEKARNKYKNLTEKEKELKRQYSKNRYNKLKQQYKG